MGHISPPETAADAVSGYIHSVETAGTVDGPGVRYILFVTGCALRCLYCHNPDTRHMKDGEHVTAASIVEDLKGYAAFLKKAGGGLTISGGEPLAQIDFTGEIFRGAKRLGLHTALDSSGFLGWRAPDSYLADVDLVLLDIKSYDRDAYRRVTGVDLQPTLDFARRLSDMRKPVWIRFVLVPELTDHPDNIRGLADFLTTLNNIERVEVLPFHKMGEFKWTSLGYEYALGNTQSPDDEGQERAREIFRSRGLTVT